MKYLNKNIEALSRIQAGKSLVRTSFSCGIFQNLEDSKSPTKLYHQQKTEKLSSK